MAFRLCGKDGPIGPEGETKEELFEFLATLDPDETFWFEDLSKLKKLSKSRPSSTE